MNSSPTPTPNDAARSEDRSELKNSELHIALLAWKNGDITMIELKKYLDADRQQSLRRLEQENFALRADLAGAMGHMDGCGHTWDYLIERHPDLVGGKVEQVLKEEGA